MITVDIFTIILINVVLLILLFVLFFYLILRKLRDHKTGLRKKQIKQKLKAEIYSYLESGDDLQISRGLKDNDSYEVIEELLEEYIEVASDDEVKKRVVHISNKYLEAYIRSKLNHRRWSLRMNALYRIEDFHLIRFVDELWNKYQLGVDEIEEQYQILRTLGSLQSQRLSSFLLYEKHDLPYFLYKEILRRYDEEEFSQFINAFAVISTPLKTATIELMGEKRDIRFVSFLEKCLRDSNLEIRLKALKGLAQIGLVSDYNLVQQFAASTIFQERLLFTKLASALKKDRDKPTLVRLLSDENWWVRNGAGEALATYEDGEMILSHVLETSEDPFARDMAKQWIGGTVNE
ncbi:HEAT repeat domain-containing protein [Alkalihalobacterium sp. APHAB7]|uniref:HEAT repeat domain-containing protein n=1 Tax=Alkalihalobacterium sp. APHAB7 TaxID=3402081 RepID=UPI003AAE7F30